tara:strand:- start:30 stop:350 length:321 start_codon:yes stop_codon:yes gene_type:complete
MGRYYGSWTIDERYEKEEFKDHPIHLTPLSKRIGDLVPHIIRTIPVNRGDIWIGEVIVWQLTRKGAKLYGIYNLTNRKLIRNKERSEQELAVDNVRFREGELNHEW